VSKIINKLRQHSRPESVLLIRRKNGRALASTLWLLIVSACLDPYPPPVSKGEINFLVVDGFLNSGSGLARVKLSRAQPLQATADFPVERRAIVQVSRADGTTFNIPEVTPGTYEAVRGDLQIGESYRLIVRTNDGNTYESEFVTLKQSPALEEVSWTAEDDGISIHVDARDPSGSTRYYQWVYTETWEYDSDRESGWFIQGGFAVSRDLVGGRVHICYSTAESSKVLISTTADQTGDVINNYQLVHIPAGSRKLSRNYSILVQQRALDEESYSYWQQVQQTSENLGGLFDPLPSRITGNIHATGDASEVVLGYFTGGGVEEKRIYINVNHLPEELRFVDRRFCPIDSILVGNLRNYIDGQGLLSPYGSPAVIGYTVTSPQCMDCRSDGGVLTKPAGWPF
jgi:hypothetical protein